MCNFLLDNKGTMWYNIDTVRDKITELNLKGFDFMTFTSTLLAVLAGIALWQIITFIGFACGLEDNDYFVYFITCFLVIPLMIVRLIYTKSVLFAFSNLFVKIDFHDCENIITSTYIAKKDRKLFKTDTKSNYYVTFEKKKFKSLPMKSDIYHKGQKYCHNVRIDNYLKKRD